MTTALPSTTTLKGVCQKILRRHNQSSVEVFQCIICDNQMKGSDALMVHLLEYHGVKIEHFDDVGDLDGMLSYLRSKIHHSVQDACASSSASPTLQDEVVFTCPVCDAACHGASDLKDHLEVEGHHEWKRATIPALAHFSALFTVDDDNDNEPDANASAAEAIAEDENNIDEEDSDDESDAGRTTCLYCSSQFALNGPLETHLLEAHQLDLPDYVKGRADVISDEYDLIRMANYVRECHESLKCPVATCNVTCSSEADWTSHVASARHFFPEVVPKEDRYLIPRLSGDMLISYLLECTWLDGDESEQYPMVDTLAQQAKKQREKSE